MTTKFAQLTRARCAATDPNLSIKDYMTICADVDKEFGDIGKGSYDNQAANAKTRAEYLDAIDNIHGKLENPKHAKRFWNLTAAARRCRDRVTQDREFHGV